MVKVKIYVIFCASDVSLVAHGVGVLHLYFGTYEVGNYSTSNQRDSITGFGPVRATSSVEQKKWHFPFCFFSCVFNSVCTYVLDFFPCRLLDPILPDEIFLLSCVISSI